MTKRALRSSQSIKARQALELLEFAEQIERQKLRRCFPDAEESEIDQKLNAWYLERPPHIFPGSRVRTTQGDR